MNGAKNWCLRTRVDGRSFIGGSQRWCWNGPQENENLKLSLGRMQTWWQMYLTL